MTRPEDQNRTDIAILEGKAPALHDEDPESLAEREVNRQWGAIHRLGADHAYDAESLIRPYLNHEDPTLRGIALVVLGGEWQRDDVLANCVDVAVDDGQDEFVRMGAVEAIVKSGGSKDPHRRPLLEWLAVSDQHPPAIRRAAAEAFR